MTPPRQPTPGPWRASQVSFANWWAVFDSANEIAATNIRVEANARLIAEAPSMQQLLWALVPLVAQFSNERWFDDDVKWILTEMTGLLARLSGKETVP